MLAGFAMVVQLGCHTFQPSYGVTPPVGQKVRVTLTDAGRALMSEQLGEAIEWVEGTLATADSTGLTMDVTLTRSLRGAYATWFSDRVVLPTRGVSQVQVRTFSKSRSWMLAGGIAVGLVVLSRVISLAVGGDGEPGDGGGCTPPACPEA
jgi:hypothetical protein